MRRFHAHRSSAVKRGFTLIELLVVMAALGLLLAISAPRYTEHVDRAREAVLRQNLASMRDAIDNDPDTDVKKKAVFALSQLPNDEGVPKLIDVARNNRNAVVRKQAMFWLGQTNDPRALKFFEDVLLR